MASLSVMDSNGIINSIELEGLSNYAPKNGDVIMFDGRVEDYNFEISGDDLVLTLPNGEELVLDNMANILSEQNEENPTKMTIASGDDGDVLVLDNFVTLTEIMEAAAAGDETSASQSANYFQNDLFGNLNSQGEQGLVDTEVEEENERRGFEEDSSSRSDDIRLDTTPPDTPTVDLKAISDTGSSDSDNYTADNTPTFSGTAESFSSITLTISGKAYSTVTDSSGNWSITIDEVSDGSYDILVTATDSAGNVSQPATISITIDTEAPEEPTADLADESDSGSSSIDNITNDNTPTIKGTGEVGSTVSITDEEGNVVGSTIVGEDGTYSITTSELEDGEQTLTITTTDTAGNSSETTQLLTIDTEAPEEPTADLADESDSGSSSIDNITNDNTPTIKGTGEVGSTVSITDEEGNVVGSTIVGEDGTYSITTSELEDGEQTLTITTTDTAGNSSETTQTVIIDTVAPTVTVDSLITTDNTPEITGTIDDPDATISVSIGEETYEAINNGDGTWTLPDDTITNLDEVGIHDIVVTATDLAGNSSNDNSSDELNIFKTTDLGGDINGTPISFTLTGDHYDSSNVEDVGSGSPQYQILINGEPYVSENGESIFSVEANRGELNENGTAIVRTGEEFEIVTFNVPEGVDVNSVSIVFVNDAYDGASNDRDGDGITGEDRNLVVDNINIGGSINDDGTYSGGVTLEAEDTDTTQYLNVNGNDVSGRETMAWNGTMTFYPDGVEIEAPTIDLISSSDSGVSDSDNITNDDTPSIKVTFGESTATGDTVSIMVDGEIVATHKISSSEWKNGSVEIEIPELADGDYEVSATISNENMSSEYSSSESITIDTTIETPTADLADESDSGSSSIDNITNDNTPTIKGTGEVGSTVSITDEEGNVVGSTIVGEDGTYSITTSELEDGEQTLTITTTDTAGNSSETTQTVTIDTVASNTDSLAITNITNDNGDFSEVVISGTGAEIGNTISLYDETGNIVATTIVSEDGTWNIDVSTLATTPVGDVESFKVTETDTAGNETGQTTAVEYYHTNLYGVYTETSDDYVMMGTGDNEVRVDNDNANNHLVIDGGLGTDEISFNENATSVNVNLETGVATTGDDNIELRSFEDVTGSSKDDIIVGSDENNVLAGGAGDDLLTGGAGDDTIRGDEGTDTVVFSGNLEDYNITYDSSNGHIIVEDIREDSPDGTDNIYGVEYFQFADGTVSTAITDAPTVDLVSSSDTGSLNNDNLTNDNTPTFQIALPTGVVAGYTITLSAGDNEVEYTLTQTDIDNGYAQITTDELGDGSYEVSATVTNLIGFESDSSSSIDVEIDTQVNAQDDVSTIAEDTISVEGNVLDNDDNDIAEVTTGTFEGEYGNITIAEDGSYTYTLNNDSENVQSLSVGEEVQDTFTYTITDEAGNEATATININVTGTNDGPIAVEETASVVEDETISGQIDASDIDGDNLTFSVSEGIDIPEGLTLNADGSYTFDASSYDSLDAGETQTIEVPITVDDGNGGITETTLTIDVSGQDNDLTYVSESAGYKNVIGYYEIDENGNPISPATVVIDDQNGMSSGTQLADLDSDKEYGFFILPNQANSIDENSIVEVDSEGNVNIINGDTTIEDVKVYHDNPEYNDDGKDHFVFESDGEGGTTIKIEDLTGLGDADFQDVVLNVNFEIDDKIGDDTQAKNDTASTTEDNSVTINVLANDKDGTGDDLTITDVESPVMLNGVAVGTAEIVDGQIVFIPNDELDSLSDGEIATLSFKYSVSDGNLGSDTAKVTLTVTGTNDAPIIEGSSVVGFVEDGASIVVNNDITLSDVDDTNLESATVKITNYVEGEDTLVFTNQNGITGSFDSEIGILTLSGTATKEEYEQALESVRYSNSSDTPDLSDRTIEFSVNDGEADSSTIISTVSVDATNDAPVVNVENFEVDKDEVLTITLEGSDVDSEINTFTLTSLPENGTLYLDAELTQEIILDNGSFTIDASSNIATLYFAPDYNESDSDSSFGPTWFDDSSISFEFYATDNGSQGEDPVDSATASVNITVDDVPFLTDVDVAKEVDENDIGSSSNSISGNVLEDDEVYQGDDGASVYQVTYTAGEESGTVTVGSTTSTAYGDLTINSDGSWTFVPDSDLDNSSGDLEFSFEYNIIDGDGDVSANTASQSITIHDGTDLSIGTTDSISVDEANLEKGSDTDTDQLSASGTLSISTGSDSVDVTFDESMELPELTHNGESVTYTYSEDGHTLTATADGVTIFTVEITDPTNVESGTGFTFTLAESIDHTDDDLDITFDFIATDADGDSVSSSFDVTIVDDEPIADTQNYVINEDGTQSFNISADVASSDDITFDGVEHGSVSYDATTGEVTYTPDEDYSGIESFTYTVTDSDGDSVTRTINVDIKPIVESDTEKISGEASGDEDSWIALNLDNPSVEDSDSEVITEVRIENIPDGASLQYSDGTPITIEDGVAIVDATKVDTIEIKAPADSNEDFSLTTKLVVIDTATLSDGESTNTKTFTGSVSVDVSGVADDTSITATDADATEKGLSANKFSVSDLISDVSFGDSSDGSETHTITIDNLPSGTKLTNGEGTLTSNGDGTYKLVFESDELDSIKLQFTNTAEGDYDLEIYSTATENDGDTIDSAVVSASLHVDPSAGEVRFTTSDVSGVEDTNIALNIDVTRNNPDGDGSEYTTGIQIASIPVGASILDADGNVLFSATEGNTTATLSLDANAIEDLQISPAENSSESFTLDVKLESTDGSVTAYTRSKSITVDLEADVDNSITIDDVTGLEDTTISLGAVYNDIDNSESGTITFSGAEVGSVFSYGNPAQSITITSEDQELQIDLSDLSSVSITPPEDYSGTMQITTVTTITDSEGDHADTQTITETFNLNVTGDADTPTLVAKNANTLEDNSVELKITALETDDSETLEITISGVPDGATLSSGIDNGDGTWTLTKDELEGLSLIPPEDSNENFSLDITVTSTDSDYDASVGGTQTKTSSTSIDVTITGDADEADISASASGDEDTWITLDLSASLSDTDGSEQLYAVLEGIPSDTEFRLVTVNEDGSTTVIDSIEGLTLAGTSGDTTDWRIDQDLMEQITDGTIEIQLLPDSDFSGEIPLTFKAITVENDGDESINEINFNVNVEAVMDTSDSTYSISASEDIFTSLNLPLTSSDGSESVVEGTIELTIPEGISYKIGDDGDVIVSDGSRVSLSNAEAASIQVKQSDEHSNEDISGIVYVRDVKDSETDNLDGSDETITETITSNISVDVKGIVDGLSEFSINDVDLTTTVESTSSNSAQWDGTVTPDVGSDNTTTQNDDTIYIDGNLNSSLRTYGGDDSVYIDGNQNGGAPINLEDGNDELYIDGNQNAAVDLGRGDDNFMINGHSNAIITAGDGNDNVIVDGNQNADVTLGNGNDTLFVDGHSNADIDSGVGNDTITINDNVTHNISTQDGDDTLIIGGKVTGSVDMSAGDDIVIVDGKITGTINGGSETGDADNDTIYLENYSYDDWIDNKDSLQDNVINFETVIFNDGKVLTDGVVSTDINAADELIASLDSSETSTSTINSTNSVTLNDIIETQSLIDQDGSESVTYYVIESLSDDNASFVVENGINAGDGKWIVTADDLENANISITDLSSGDGSLDLQITPAIAENDGAFSFGEAETFSITYVVDEEALGVDSPEIVLNTSEISSDEDTNITDFGVDISSDTDTTLTYTIEGFDNGSTYITGENYLLPDGTTVVTDIDSINFSPDSQYSGDASVTINVIATSSDGGVTQQEQQIDFTIDAVTDNASVSLNANESIEIDDGESINLNFSIKSADRDGSETLISEEIIISLVDEDGDVDSSIGILSGEGVIDNGDGTYTISASDSNTLEENLSAIIFTPSETNYDGTYSFKVSEYEWQESGLDAVTVAEKTVSFNLSSEVDSVEVSLSDETSVVSEGSVSALELSFSQTDTDGSEIASVVLEGLPSGTTIGYFDDNGTWHQAGTPKVDENGDLQWILKDDEIDHELYVSTSSSYSGEFSISAVAYSYDLATGEIYESATDTKDFVVEAVASDVSIDADISEGLENQQDIPVSLNIVMDDSDGSETLNITFSDVPEGASFSIGYSDGEGNWIIEGATIDEVEALTFSAPEYYSGEINLDLSIQTVDSGGNVTDISDSVNSSLSIEVASVASDFTDDSSLNVEIGEYSATSSGISVPVSVTGIDLNDTDGSEILTIAIVGLGSGAVVTYLDGDTIKTATVDENNTWHIEIDPSENPNYLDIIQNIQISSDNADDIEGSIEISAIATDIDTQESYILTDTQTIDSYSADEALIEDVVVNSANEDHVLDLNITMPTLTNSGGSSEKLGVIQVSLPTGSYITDNSGNILATSDAQSNVSIIIVDENGEIDNSIHPDDISIEDAITMTQSEYESLNITPPSDYNGDMDIDITYTTYEVDDSNEIIEGIDSTTTTQTTTVTVDEVVDEFRGTDGSDTLSGTDGNDLFYMNDIEDSIDGGSGLDTLIMEDDMTFDFDSFADNQITNIDIIDMGVGDEGTSLENIDIEDVISMTSADSEDEQIMKILGDSEDSVSLDDSWTKAESITEGENEFDVYTGGENDNIKIYIEQEIHVDI